MTQPRLRPAPRRVFLFEFLESRQFMSTALPAAPPVAPPAMPPAPAMTAAPITSNSILPYTRIADSPILRAEGFGGMVNGKLYVLGGYCVIRGGIITPQRRCDVYDPATNKWTRLPSDLPDPVADGATVIDGTNLWLIGGFLNNVPGPGSRHVWKFDTLTGKFSRGPDLPEIRGSGFASIIGRTIHFIGGGADKTSVGTVADHLTLDLDDPSATWQTAAPLTNGRNHAGTVTINGSLFVVGGQVGQEKKAIPTREVDRYDPATDTWSRVADLPAPRSHITTSTIVWNNKILVVGGDDKPNSNNRTLLCYDPATNRWAQIGLLPTRRATAVCAILSGNRLLFSTGNNPSASVDGYIVKLP